MKCPACDIKFKRTKYLWKDIYRCNECGKYLKNENFESILFVALPVLLAPGLISNKLFPFWIGLTICIFFFASTLYLVFKSLFKANIVVIQPEEGERLLAMHITPKQLLFLIVSSVVIIVFLLLFMD